MTNTNTVTVGIPLPDGVFLGTDRTLPPPPPSDSVGRSVLTKRCGATHDDDDDDVEDITHLYKAGSHFAAIFVLHYLAIIHTSKKHRATEIRE